MKYLTDKFDLSMVYLSKLSMIRCKKIKKEDILISDELIPLIEDDFVAELVKGLFKINPRKSNIHIMIGENDIVYYIKYVGPKFKGACFMLDLYEITVDYTECSKCSAKGTIDCKNCGRMDWLSGEEI